MPDMLVRYKKGKTNFEIITKEGSVSQYREGTIKNTDDVVVANVIFTNHSKGERASDEQLRSAFDTDDLSQCLEKILLTGEPQLSVAERKAKVEQKRKEIVDYFRKYYVEPRTKLPLPAQRIDAALTQAKIRVDPDTPAARQAADAASKVVAVMPMSKSTLDGTIKIPHQYVGSAMGSVSKYCQVVKDGYTSEGSSISVSVAPGDYDMLISDLTKATKGNFTFDIEGQQKAMASGNEATEKKKGGKVGKKGKGGKK
ncbi:hypothetical protein NDN08_003279 [Rhodosorus marinus]|uniref:Ribosome maturation protein SDO1/SBDS N-terminal domain-containing protein n=1 Tax=Rhodosorus marinus TaxID=101924 RepID=A0AAV8UYS2_9RHOD|nr:hypothetical protein NDN08_003279 [Rhodosorus marinus]